MATKEIRRQLQVAIDNSASAAPAAIPPNSELDAWGAYAAYATVFGGGFGKYLERIDFPNASFPASPPALPPVATAGPRLAIQAGPFIIDGFYLPNPKQADDMGLMFEARLAPDASAAHLRTRRKWLVPGDTAP
jgi:hypothetical protein